MTPQQEAAALRNFASLCSFRVIQSSASVLSVRLAALRRGNRNAGDFQIHGTEMGAAGEVKRSPVIAAERDVGGRRLPVHDAAELLALQVEDPDAARAAAIDVPGRVDLHAVGDAGLAVRRSANTRSLCLA